MKKFIVCLLIVILAAGFVFPLLNSVNNNKAEAASPDTCNHSNLSK